MPSPFPGMDPWLENASVFPDLHDRLAIYLSEEIGEALPPEYIAITSSTIWIEQENREPDVSLLGIRQPQATDNNVVELEGCIGVAERLASRRVKRRQLYLKILSTDGRRLVTSIEILSRSNKAKGSKGHRAYRRKQRQLESANVNMVEIDLLRCGTHTTMLPLPAAQDRLGEFDYHVSIFAPSLSNTYYAVPIRLEQPLPSFAVPLDPGIKPIVVHLQPMLDRAYDKVGYHKIIDYNEPPEPPLTVSKTTWANAILKHKGVV